MAKWTATSAIMGIFDLIGDRLEAEHNKGISGVRQLSDGCLVHARINLLFLQNTQAWDMCVFGFTKRDMKAQIWIHRKKSQSSPHCLKAVCQGFTLDY